MADRHRAHLEYIQVRADADHEDRMAKRAVTDAIAYGAAGFIGALLLSFIFSMK